VCTILAVRFLMTKHHLTLSLLLLSCLTTSGVHAQYTLQSLAERPSDSFTGFSAPSIYQGRVAFSDGTRIQLSDGTTTTTLVEQGDVVPQKGHTFLGFADPVLSADTVAFQGSYPFHQGIFTTTREGTISPPLALTLDANSFGTFSRVTGVAVGNSLLAFHGSFSLFATNHGIFTADSKGLLSAIAKTGDILPQGKLTSVSVPSFDGETIAFTADYLPNNGFFEVSGIFTSTAGKVTPLLLPGDISPLGTLTSFGQVSQRQSTTAFVGSAGGQNYGILAKNSSGIRVIARAGETTPFGELSNLHSPSTNGLSTAFIASTSNSFFNLFAETNGVIARVLGEGDSLFGSTVSQFQFGTTGIDDEGNLAFGYRLADGRTGIGLAKSNGTQAIPEPGTLGLLALGLAGLTTGFAGGSRRRY
jgi:PEP-CTERM motif